MNTRPHVFKIPSSILKVQWNERTGTWIASEASGDEYEKYWQWGVSYDAGSEKYKEPAAHWHIPVMALEPKR